METYIQWRQTPYPSTAIAIVNGGVMLDGIRIIMINLFYFIYKKYFVDPTQNNVIKLGPEPITY